MNFGRVLGASLAALAMASTVAFAEVETYKLDPAHTRASFAVRHIFTKVPGHFKEVEGTIRFDEQNIANSSVEAVIQAASVFTDNEKRDGHLKTEDFFWVEKHPTLTFESKKIIPGEDGAFQIVGDLTIRGVTKEVTFDAQMLGVADLGEKMGKRAGFEATATIDRKDYGIHWNRALDHGGLLLGDAVEIALTVEAITASAIAANL